MGKSDLFPRGSPLSAVTVTLPNLQKPLKKNVFYRVFIIHRTLMWTTGSLTCVCVVVVCFLLLLFFFWLFCVFVCLFVLGGLHAYIHGSNLVYSPIRRTLVGLRVCTEF